MKKNFKFVVALLAAAFAVFSCSKIAQEERIDEEVNNGESTVNSESIITITAYLPEEAESRVNITEAVDYSAAQLTWENTDQITIVSTGVASTATFGVSEITEGGKKAVFTGTAPEGTAPYTIFYHKSRPLTLDKFNSITCDGQVQNGNGSTSHLQYGVKLVNVNAYEAISFTQTWASANGGTLAQNSVLQLLLKLPDDVEEVYSIYVHDDGSFAQTLWLTNVGDVFVTPNSKHVVKGYMMVPDMDLTGNLNVRVETEDGAYEAAYPLTETDWVGGAQYTVQKNMSGLSAVTGEHAAMEIHAACAQDILQFKAGVTANKARFNGSTVTVEKDIDMTPAGTWSTYIPQTFVGTLDGNSKTLSNLTATAPLFEWIVNGATVKNLTLEGDYTYTQLNAGDYFGTLAKQFQGTLSGVIVNANITIGKASRSNLFDLGGLVGRANNVSARITNCQYNGNIEIPTTYTNSRSLRLGGLVGYISKALTIEGSSFGGTIKCLGHSTKAYAENEPGLEIGGIVGRNQKGIISGCSTTDAVTKASVKIDETTYQATILVQSSKSIFTAIGGIVGFNYDGGQVKLTCTNRASIFDNITTAASTLDVGGIAGNNSNSSSAATITSSTNYAALTHLSKSPTQHLGGVIGFETGNSSGCTNESTGSVTVNGAAQDPKVGGVIGEKSNGTISGTVCNKGNVTVNSLRAGAYGCYVGGVIGKTSIAIDGGGSKTVSNTGTIRVNADSLTTGISCLGGIVGYTSADISNASNGGGLEFNGKYKAAAAEPSAPADATSNVCVGGILGITESAITVSGCTNDGSAYYGKDSDTRVDGKDSFVGGIIGKMTVGGTISSCSHKRRQIRNQNFNNTHSLAGGAFCGGIVGALVGTSEHPGSITGVTVSEMDDGKYCAYGKRGDNGGIAGYVSYTTIDGTSCSGDPYGTNGSAKVAGAVAWMVASTLQNFKFTGNVKNGASANMGGLVYTLDATSEVKDCIFDGVMQYTGGVVAYTASAGAKITNCGVRGTKNGVAITTANSDILGTGSATITGTYAYSE